MQITLKNICRMCDGKTILDNISLSLKNGDFLGIAGAAGAGKSTLLQIIAGLEKPDSGSVTYESADKEACAILFQDASYQLFGASVGDAVSFPLKYSSLSAGEIQQKVLTALTDAGVDGPEKFVNRPIYSLSGGEKRKTALAGALIMSPQVLLLDEPFAGLDCRSKEAVLASLQRFHARGNSVVIVSHDMDMLCENADRIAVLSHGKVLACGTPAEIFFTEKENFLPVPEIVRLTGFLKEKGVVPASENVVSVSRLAAILKDFARRSDDE